jgi:hypothetical protein
MDDLHAHLRDLPVELKAIVLSHIEHVKTRQILALTSREFQKAFSMPGALPRTFDFEEVAGDDIAYHLVRLLDDDRVRSLEKGRALELIGVHKKRLCDYACVQGNFAVLKWAHNELNLPWVRYPAGPVSDDVLVLRMLREAWPPFKQYWRVDVGPKKWRGVTMVDGRVVKLELTEMGLTGAVPVVIGQLTSLRELYLGGNKLTSVPPEIGQLTSLKELHLWRNQLTSVPPEIGQLTSLTRLDLGTNQLTSLPAEIGQLTSLWGLYLDGNQLTSVPAEIWELTSLEMLSLRGNQLTSVPAEIGQLTSLKVLALGGNQLKSVPPEIGQLTSLTKLYLGNNQLTSLPAEIGLLTSLRELHLHGNQLTSVPAAIRELRAAGCQGSLDPGVTVDE